MHACEDVWISEYGYGCILYVAVFSNRVESSQLELGQAKGLAGSLDSLSALRIDKKAPVAGLANEFFLVVAGLQDGGANPRYWQYEYVRSTSCVYFGIHGAV